MTDANAKATPAVNEVALNLTMFRHDGRGLSAVGHLHLVHEGHPLESPTTINRIGQAAREKVHSEVDEFLDQVNRRWDYLMGDKSETLDLIPDSELLLLGYLGDGIPMPVGATTRYETLVETMVANGLGSPAEIATAIASIRETARTLIELRALPESPTVPAVEPELQP